ncbi:phage tail protein [Polynucleobacter sp. JS-Safj-400b-B2]|uniref:phage tail protein n=1 Tax=Polynucleobacter sp. JS-Safj-400b-B2 TaxID=2576921 RepID=UPI001C0BA57C|nr:phage tail protein [Polynucleobacter sp. JS-Safj-400b-B2]MBU3625731.1 phage tail protein [Polynucleobacter sp. JS-Safj-400b-B2]
MPIVQQGQINPIGSNVPNWWVQIMQPSAAPIVGAQSNVSALVGTASWGPVNQIAYGGGIADYKAQFGPIMPRKYDMGAHVTIQGMQGASMFMFVRVTDGTDTSATGTITAASAADATAIALAINSGQSSIRGASALINASANNAVVTLSSKYTGSYGNNTAISVATGTRLNTTKVTVSMPGRNVETFDNLGAASATVASITLAGGTDGYTGVTSTSLVGVDGTNRTGMYALRKSGAAVVSLCDADDSTQWASQAAFGLGENCYVIGTGPAGDTIANAVSTKNTAGIDNWCFRLQFGDWTYFNDTDNGLIRLVSPQAAIAGLRAAYAPHLSLLNRPMQGIVGTQRNGLPGTSVTRPYSDADLLQLANAGIDVISNPSVGGNFFSSRIGHNTSSNPLTRGDNYTSLTNFIAKSIGGWSGQWVGKLQTIDQRRQAKAGLDGFFASLQNQGMIGAVNGGPAFWTKLDAGNNPLSQVSLGIEQADVKVQYWSVIETFLVNVEGSQATVIPSGAPVPAAQ